MNKTKALVLFSGGQDSTTCLAWALDRFARRRNRRLRLRPAPYRELEARPKILSALREKFPAWAANSATIMFCRCDVLKAIGGTALTDDMKIEMGANGLPTTFVPGRNILFLTAAAALAYRRGIANLVGGMCETDFSGYPDCRDVDDQGDDAMRSISAWMRNSRCTRR